MRHVPPFPLWLGHAADARDVRGLYAAGIAAMVDLAMNEPPVVAPRDLVCCRFPLVDGADNPPWLLRAAVHTIAHLLAAGASTLVFCSAGMSRTPAVAAAALALLTRRSPEECLGEIGRTGATDISPALWRDLTQAVTREA